LVEPGTTVSLLGIELDDDAIHRRTKMVRPGEVHPRRAAAPTGLLDRLPLGVDLDPCGVDGELGRIEGLLADQLLRLQLATRRRLRSASWSWISTPRTETSAWRSAARAWSRADW